MNRTTVILGMIFFGIASIVLFYTVRRQRNARQEVTWQEEREGANEGHHELVV